MLADNLIDRVAREITAGVPTPDLAERVRDRIARTPQQRPWSWTVVAAAGLATAAVVLAAIVVRPAMVSPGIPNIQAPGIQAIAESRPPAIPESEDPFATGNPGMPDPRTARPASASAATEWHARAVPALPEIQALAIERIQPTALSIPLLEVEPLVVPTSGGDR